MSIRREEDESHNGKKSLQCKRLARHSKSILSWTRAKLRLRKLLQ